MNKINEPFEIEINSAEGESLSLQIRHDSETFDMDYQGMVLSLINNSDNTWSSVKGKLDQETVNLIGDAIERHYRQMQT